MFHIKSLELVHWDYWRRFNLPLDETKMFTAFTLGALTAVGALFLIGRLDD